MEVARGVIRAWRRLGGVRRLLAQAGVNKLGGGVGQALADGLCHPHETVGNFKRGGMGGGLSSHL